ncbi:MAG TPA: hypothetical protein VGC65_00200 [Bacteroidia bacterium]|jgi:hypothetical protein
MSTLRSIKYQVINVEIPAANAEVSTSQVNTDKNFKTVTGIQAIATDATAFNKGTFDKFLIGGQEIYPEGFDIKLISCGNEVDPNDRFDKDINEPAEGSTVNITIADGGTATAYPYTAKVVLKLEKPIR